jgi:hypothetical protein
MQVRKKLRRLERFAYLGAIVGIVIAVRRARGRRAAPELGPPAEWPPLEPALEAPVAALGDLAAPPARPPAPSVAPFADGSCPSTHPGKANRSSKIFHEPGGRFYDRTRAERCYVDAASAAADGYRAAKGANGSEGSKSQEERP